MQEVPQLMVTRILAETSASADLDDVCRWLIRGQVNPVRLDVDDLPALRQGSTLRLATPIRAQRAALCAAWLLEDVDPGGCLLAGHLRFVAHPTGSDIRLSFRGRIANAMGPGLPLRQADLAARQLLDVIAASIGRPSAVARRRASQPAEIIPLRYAVDYS
jgi:hypothetical protein